jgi:hypothetical protein
MIKIAIFEFELTSIFFMSNLYINDIVWAFINFYYSWKEFIISIRVEIRVPKIANFFLHLHSRSTSIFYNFTPTPLWNIFQLHLHSNSINSFNSTQTSLLFFKIKAYFAYKDFKLQKCNASHLLNKSSNISLLSVRLWSALILFLKSIFNKLWFKFCKNKPQRSLKNLKNVIKQKQKWTTKELIKKLIFCVFLFWANRSLK